MELQLRPLAVAQLVKSLPNRSSKKMMNPAGERWSGWWNAASKAMQA